jgi:hypothetical protein
MVFGHNGGMVGYVSTLRVDLPTGLGVVVLMNGPGSPVELGRAIVGTFAATSDTPPPSAGPSPAVAALAGDYVSEDGDRRFTLDATPDGLQITPAGRDPITVESWGDDQHLVPDPAWDRFMLVVERGPHEPDVLWHGETRFVPAGAVAPPLPSPDPALLAHRGQYRSHDPWSPTFRVLLRGDRLWVQFPETPDGAEPEEPLIPLADGTYRLGEDPSGPERIRFDLPIGGLTRRAWLGVWPWYRVGD